MSTLDIDKLPFYWDCKTESWIKDMIDLSQTHDGDGCVCETCPVIHPSSSHHTLILYLDMFVLLLARG